tara:strand:+ start:825 stop:1019 length:195 start_codon:yes stop_codon:yes gene_type:complete
MQQYNSDSTNDKIKLNYKYTPSLKQIYVEDDILKIFDKVYNLKFDPMADNKKFNELLNWIEDEF